METTIELVVVGVAHISSRYGKSCLIRDATTTARSTRSQLRQAAGNYADRRQR
jgi:hypothetical protein